MRPRLVHARWSALGAAIVAMAALAASDAARAQPLGASLLLSHSGNQYVEVPSSPDLTPSSAMTIEFLASTLNTDGDVSLVGKDYLSSYWIGNNNGTLASWFNGAGCVKGKLRAEERIHHIAVTYDGAQVKNYIDGELVGVCAGSGPIHANTSPLRFGSDVHWAHSPTGFLDEIRLWSIARTQQQIQQDMGVAIASPRPGLVAVWPMDALANDPVGGHNGGAPHGGASIYYAYHPGGSCSPTAHVACFNGGQFGVQTQFQLYSNPAPDGSIAITSEGTGTVVSGASSNSALFWFFAPDNWEVLVKSLDGCGLGNHWWTFAAATTNVHHSIVVFDFARGEQRVYWSFFGPPAPALTDTVSFSCEPPA